MSNIWFCSDLHFGHKNIQKFRLEVSSEEDNRQKIINDWSNLVKKRDIVYVLGDAAFTEDGLESIKNLKGDKILIRGNHDMLPITSYLKCFKEVYGLFRYKEFWLSHAPIHPNELREKVNLHGHVHYSSIKTNQYVNCCVENLVTINGYSMINLEQVREHIKSRL